MDDHEEENQKISRAGLRSELRIVARFPATDEVLVASGVLSEERVLRKLFFIQQASNLEVFSAGQELND
jgi:hypothetical protein